MTIKKIVFFNHAHRGDVFLSRPFVKEIQEKINVEFYYFHYWGEYLLKDLNMGYDTIEKLPSINQHVGHRILKDVLYINTWIGNYFSHSKPRYGQCNLKSIYSLMYEEIYNLIRSTFQVDLKLNDILNYFPEVDYSYFNIENIDLYLKQNESKKVLLCNGPALSGQCEYNGDMKEIVEVLSQKYPNVSFITTHKINFDAKNVYYTGDIIKNDGPDLNEISYLSTFCDIIVGRSSGPFTFSNLKDNIFDDKKSFLCFGKRETDCLPYELDINSTFVFQYFSEDNKLEELIETIIELIEQ